MEKANENALSPATALDVTKALIWDFEQHLVPDTDKAHTLSTLKIYFQAAKNDIKDRDSLSLPVPNTEREAVIEAGQRIVAISAGKPFAL